LAPANQARGRAGEYLVAFDFASRGYSTMINPDPTSPYDVLVDAGKEKILKIQVKATRAAQVQNGWVSYKFQLGRRRDRYHHVDVYAFVALDTKAIWYCRPKELPATSSTISIPPKRFQAKVLDSLEALLSSL